MTKSTRKDLEGSEKTEMSDRITLAEFQKILCEAVQFGKPASPAVFRKLKGRLLKPGPKRRKRTRLGASVDERRASE